jgi:hypothetical protein
MWCRIAALLGVTPREAKARCSSHDYAELAAFYEHEPWGIRSASWQLAIVGARIIAALTGKRVDPKELIDIPYETKRDWSGAGEGTTAAERRAQLGLDDDDGLDLDDPLTLGEELRARAEEDLL